MQKYLNIISNYRKLKKNKPDTWLSYCESQSDLQSAINCASLAKNQLDKRHPHQYRLKQSNLQLLADTLNQKSSEILNLKTFDELYNLVSSIKISGIGALTIYDTANRIGKYLGIEPEYIYIHAGTKAGLEKLIGHTKLQKINKQDLPEPLKNSDLTPAELEDVLCIYKRLL
jgi:hypothetical protein